MTVSIEQEISLVCEFLENFGTFSFDELIMVLRELLR